MEKERALEIVRKRYAPDGVDDTLRIALETLIPELTESKDERIRKWLYDYISNCPNNNFAFYGGVGKDAVLNYLEKQKEQKPNIEICPHSTKSKSYKETGYPSVTRFVYKKSDEKFIRDCANILKANDYGASAERLLSMLEQKPAEWSEDFGKEVESVHKRYPEVSFAKLTRIAYHFAKWADKYKSTEWSEEDRRTIDRACVALRAYANGELPDILPSELLGYADKLQSLFYGRDLNL